MGIVRAILESPQYMTLAFPRPSLNRVTVVDIAIEQPQNTQDGSSVIMGRVTFDVSVCEGVQLLTGQDIGGYKTEVKMNETDKGYQFSNIVIP